MNKLTLLFLALHIFQGTVQSQFNSSCLPDGIRFNTQAEIDNFQANYPGCTEIEGDAIIQGSDVYGITNLIGLSILTSIGGNLSIGDGGTGNLALTSLTGLENLTSIGGGLTMSYNIALTSLTGLEGLTFIGGSFTIWGCNALTSLMGLDNLISIGGSLGIAYNISLTSLSGLENLTSMGGELTIGIWEYGNPTLTSLSGLENLTSMGGDLHIESNDALTSLTGLAGLTSIVGNLHIFDNNSLSICEAQWLCDYLSNPVGSINIYGNAAGCNNPPEVAEACGIALSCLPYGNYYFRSQAQIDNFQFDYPGCTELEGNFEIAGNDITSLNGLNVVASIGGNLDIGTWGMGNPVLTSLTGLENLISIGGYVGFEFNDSLTSLSGLDGLTSVGDYLNIFNNNALTSLSGLASLAFIEGHLEIKGNSSLNSLTGLDGLTSVGDYVSIMYNCELINLTGLEELTSIGGDLFISYNTSLNSLSGLEDLTSIGGSLLIGADYWGNPALTSITGLENIDAGSIMALEIRNNTSLSTCEVQSICNYLISPNGYIFINNNAPGCNSQEEVEAACAGVGFESAVSSQQSTVNSYPNPTGGISHFSFRISQCQWVSLKIYNTQGQEVAVVLDKQLPAGEHMVRWDAGKLPEGIYFYQLSTDDCRLTTGKLVKY